MTFLKRASGVEGLYVPLLYDVTYHEDGTIASMEPNCKEAPNRVKKQVVTDLSDTYYPSKPLVPYIRYAGAESCWKSSVDVSADAVSVRRG